ncbi:MAG: hydroxymethylbilane synthase [Candidatus Kapaibacteriota bacterium]
MKKQKLIIGSRGSELALWQANFVKRELERKNKNLSVDIKIIKTKGDKILDVALSKIGDKGLFTKELEKELLKGTIDIAVHSLKDLPTDLHEELTIGAVLPRDNPEDVLISKYNKLFTELPSGATIGTSSLRRMVQIKRIRPDLNVQPLRGNITTRITKLYHSDIDAIIVSRAAIERLELQNLITEIFSPEVIIPAVGQGVIALEIRNDNLFAKEILEGLNSIETEYAVRAERAFLRELGGGCKNPIAAFAEIVDYEIYIEGMVASADGEYFFRDSTFGLAMNPEDVGRKLAQKLIALGAKTLLSRKV